MAYAAAAMGRLDPERPISLCANFVGACLILGSLLLGDFNLSAAVMEGAWAAVALFGLVRWALKKRAFPRVEDRGRG